MIFQPHRFSRTAQLFDDFIKVLKKVDSVVLLDIYAASEKPIKGIDSRTIVETLKQQGHKDVTYLKNHNDINALIKQRRDDFDIFDIIKNPDNNIQEDLEKEQVLSDVKELVKDLPADQNYLVIAESL